MGIYPDRVRQSGRAESPPARYFHRKFQTCFSFTKCIACLKTVFAMNKAELIEAVQTAMGKEATKRSAEDAVTAVLDSIANGVRADQKVQLIGFGTFEVKNRAARMGRNPKTGEPMQINASKSVGFKASAALKGSL
jgi:DNA-binding protein HU-beta